MLVVCDLGDSGPNAISLLGVVVDRGGIGGVETAEKNCVMVGWDGSVVLRLRLRDGGGWRRWRAAGLGGERDVVGDWAAVGGGMGSRGLGCSIHPSARLSRCVLGELGVEDRVFGREIIIGGVEIAYMRVSGLLG